LAYVPAALILAGMAAYTVLAGADFGAGLWTLLAFGRGGVVLRDHARHAMGPVWEANHVWLIFVLVVCWTGYPVAFGSITSTLAAPLLIAAIGIIFRGAAYALRGQGASRAAENLFAVSSVLTPFALGAAVGAIALGRVPVGNALGNPVTSWLNPGSVLIGVLAVAFSGYLAAVYLAADALRYAELQMASRFRERALVSGLASGTLALTGLLVMRHFGLNLTHGVALAMVCVSTVAGLATLALCWRSAFGLARLTAAAAVAAVVVGWAVAQSPRLLPGMTVTQAAAGRSTLVALVIAVACGAVVLVPSLALLYTLFLRGRLDTPEHSVPAAEASAASSPAAEGARLRNRARYSGTDRANEHAVRGGAAPASGAGRVRGWGAAALVGLVGGTVLLVFTDAPWEHVLGVLLLALCAVSVFTLAAPTSGEE
jgi:cytochrome bd ubiquinol oxidase subunit II